jgi:hypothetical protein
MRYEPSAIAALNPITWVASASSQRNREPGRFARNVSRKLPSGVGLFAFQLPPQTSIPALDPGEKKF